ncbi:hypothetical protein SD37_09400 [Amycolatopsis orientalis]|uniref:Uncharacterized protein n=1 Tax=Amycolatopsis orientalis TaxID=31958 RepID=A0A193BUF1_AMYOR|nr:hypothetical protein [Amycolatopsis orientalis]ANN15842.1 hypothetical protein SD37_09400 [Amycolatopsis orientalis]
MTSGWRKRFIVMAALAGMVSAAAVLPRALTQIQEARGTENAGNWGITTRLTQSKQFSHWMTDLLRSTVGNDAEAVFRRALRGSPRISPANQGFFTENQTGIRASPRASLEEGAQVGHRSRET